MIIAKQIKCCVKIEMQNFYVMYVKFRRLVFYIFLHILLVYHCKKIYFLSKE